MNDKDRFAVWLAETMLNANGDAMGAATLSALAGQAERDGAELDEVLQSAQTGTVRPGDFGLEFVGAALPVLLVEFGRMLWEAYAKGLVEESGKALAKASIDGVKSLLRRTFGSGDASLTRAQAEAMLHQVGARAGLKPEEIETLLRGLRTPEAVRALAGE